MTSRPGIEDYSHHEPHRKHLCHGQAPNHQDQGVPQPPAGGSQNILRHLGQITCQMGRSARPVQPEKFPDDDREQTDNTRHRTLSTGLAEGWGSGCHGADPQTPRQIRAGPKLWQTVISKRHRNLLLANSQCHAPPQASRSRLVQGTNRLQRRRFPPLERITCPQGLREFTSDQVPSIRVTISPRSRLRPGTAWMRRNSAWTWHWRPAS